VIDKARHASRLTGDNPAAASASGLVDRSALALISVERTRMPMIVSDPLQPDNPIVLANSAFLKLTGYTADEVVGRNCRFLQGPRTDPAAIQTLRDRLAEGGDITIELLNYRKDGTAFWNELHISPIHDDDGQLVYHFASQMDVTDRRQAQALEQVEHRLLKEVDHRAKNALALVQGIVRLSQADDSASYARAVQGRVDSLARAHGLLAAGGWQDVDLDTIVRAEMEPFGRKQIMAGGDPIAIPPAQVQPLALVLHEMLSNAVVHGSLSAPNGRVDIRWWMPDAESVTIEWIERGGPVVHSEVATGFGWRMATGIVRSQLRGAVTFALEPEGLRATLRLRRRLTQVDGAMVAH
jgi:PAS domain S-box-containing protein